MQLRSATRLHLDGPWPAARTTVGAQPEGAEAQRVAVDVAVRLAWLGLGLGLG